MANKTIAQYSPAVALQTGDKIIFQRGSNYFYVDASASGDHLSTDDITEGSNLYASDANLDTWVETKDTDDLAEGSTNKYASTSTLNTWLATKTTTNLAEGAANHYFQPAHVTLDNTAISDLFDTPQSLNLAITSGQTYMVSVAVAHSYITTTGYGNSGIDIIDATTGTTLFEFPSTLLSGSSGVAAHGSMVTGGVIITDGADISVKAKSANPTGGDPSNTLKVFVEYRVLDMSSLA